MKTVLALSGLFITSICLNACDSCGPFGEGNTWEKQNHTFMVPFYPDSAKGDTVYITMTNIGSSSVPEIIYSSTLDSFRIVTDVRGSNFEDVGTDTIWKPVYYYDFEYRTAWLYLSYGFDRFNTAKFNSQTPQCTPAFDDIDVKKLRIEVPKDIKFVKLFGR